MLVIDASITRFMLWNYDNHKFSDAVNTAVRDSNV